MSGASRPGALTRQAQEKCLEDLVLACVMAGLTEEQTREIWWIVAGTFNRLGQAREAS